MIAILLAGHDIPLTDKSYSRARNPIHFNIRSRSGGARYHRMASVSGTGKERHKHESWSGSTRHEV